MNKAILLTVLTCLYCFFATAQAPRIIYSAPEKQDSRRTAFDVIGKVGSNYIVYKNNRSDNDFCVYDENMKLKERVRMGDINSERMIDMEFIAYADYFYAIYQYQRRNIIYCNAIKFNADAKKLTDPIELDTTQISFAANNKIYTTVSSDDKQKIMVFKINNKNQSKFYFTTMLFDSQLKLQKKDRMLLNMQQRADYLSDFLLSNDGELVFSKYERTSTNSEFISKVELVIKYPDSSNFSINNVGIGARILDELKLKVDNTNKRILLSSLFYKQKRGNIEGLYLMKWDKVTNTKILDTPIVFNDELRNAAKGEEANKKMAFNDYYIKNIVMRKDGGFLIVGEALFTSSRGGFYNRWDYMNWGNPWISPIDYYYYRPWGMPWNRNFGSGITRYHAENIMLLSFNKAGDLEWTNVIPKSQYDDDTDNLISFASMNTGGQLHFLFNQYERRNLLLNDQSIGPDGKILRNPTLKNLDKGYEFMPRLGKQVSANVIIVPCWYRNYLCLSKIEF
jgi:hypothetical protein